MESEQDEVALQQFFQSLECEQRGASHGNRSIVPEGQRKCPICGEPMTSTHENSVMIDLCEEHGMWLDKDELRAIVTGSQQSELVKKLKAREAAGEEAAAGLLSQADFMVGYSLGRWMG